LNRSSSLRKQQITGTDRVGYLLATGFGAGLLPKAPGTFGAIEGVLLFLAIYSIRLNQPGLILLLAIVNVIVFAVGVWASNCCCRITGMPDPQMVVIDEVSGQLISLTPLAFLPELSVAGVVVGFALFRLFDIFKPYPIRKLERLHGGLGVMADDALAGAYAAVLLWVIHLVGLI